MNAYCTTKFAVLGFSESLRIELAPHGIGVTAVCPGLIDTPIVDSAPLRGAAAQGDLRARLADTYARRGYGPERVAENILKAIRRNRAVAPIAPEAWALYYGRRFAPWLVNALARASSKQMDAAGKESS